MRNNVINDFWKRKSLEDMTHEEWESLCDFCGRCCLHKLEDIETQEICHTRVSCRLLNPVDSSCTKYNKRMLLVPDCVKVAPHNIQDIIHWMPKTCSYKLLYHKKDLPPWHPLITNDPLSTTKSGNSVAGKTISELDVLNLDDHIINEEDL